MDILEQSFLSKETMQQRTWLKPGTQILLTFVRWICYYLTGCDTQLKQDHWCKLLSCKRGMCTAQYGALLQCINFSLFKHKLINLTLLWISVFC